MSVEPVDFRKNRTAVTTRGPSPDVWADCPWHLFLEDPGAGICEFHDFISGGKITAPTTEAALVGLPLSGFSSTASQVSYGNATYTTSVNDAGTIVLAETTDDEATNMRSAVTPYRISANFGQLWFETRLKISTIATVEMSIFAGLMENTAGLVAVPLLTTGELADQNLVGFHKPEANTTTFNGSYKANTVTAVASNSGIGTLAADTYLKLGMVFNRGGDNKLRWFVNNQEQATKKTIPDNTGTDFPADVALGWMIAMAVASAASDNTLTCDWVRVAQAFVS